METMIDGVKQTLSEALLADEVLLVPAKCRNRGCRRRSATDNLFITDRGFSFAKSVMEMHKQENKKCTQKSKSLRRKLPTS